ncbi:MAG TPA: pyridoxamine 5'-phosphate oxidase family protein [Acidimicrobiales bacterium]
MATSRRGPWIEYLSEGECWHLLSLHTVGRVGILVGGAPEIYPVNYTVDGTSIVFRTDPGNKLRSIASTPEVCFEVDGLDFEHETGWSVLVKGSGAEVPAEEVGAKARDDLMLWAIGERTHWVRISPHEVTGRRLGRGVE